MGKRIITPITFLVDLSYIPVGVEFTSKVLEYIGFDPFESNMDFSGEEIFLKFRMIFLKNLELNFNLIPKTQIFIGKSIDSLFYFDLKFSSEPFPKIEIDKLAFGLKFSKDLIQSYKYDLIVPNDPSQGKTWKIDEEQDGYSLAISSGIKADIHGNFDVFEPEITGVEPFMIGNTGFIVDLAETNVGKYIKDDTFSQVTGKLFHLVFDSIPEEIVDDVPPNFKGLWIKQAFIYYHKPDSGTKIPPIGLQKAAIGEGGFSGDLIVGNPKPVIELNSEQLSTWFGDSTPDASFTFESDFAARISLLGVDAILWSLRLSFYQSIPNAFSLTGAMRTGLSEKWIAFKASIGGPDGDLFLEVGGLPEEPLLNLETDWYKVIIDSIAYKLQDNIHYAIINGGVQLKIEPLDLPLLKVDRLSVGSDGSIDIEGGWAEFPETVSVNFGGFKVELKELGMGTEGEGDAIRQWFGFSGGIKLLQGLKGGASVEGLKVSWYKDRDEKDIRVSLKGIEVELEIPDTLKIHGKINYDEDTNLFRGMVDLDFQSLDFEVHGELIVGKTKDETGREFSVFYIALSAKTSVGITLGSTGLALYGIAGLYGVNVTPTKTDDQKWYDWYVSDPAYNIIANQKWGPAYDHFAFGAGVNVGTIYDGGYSLNADIMFAILIPGPVIMLEGKAELLQVLKTDDLKVADNNMAKQVSNKENKEEAKPVEAKKPGNFYLLAVFDGNKGTFSLNIDIKLVIQELVNIGGGLEAFFDFNDSSKWYIHIGVDEPESKRIQAEVLAIFSASVYFMVSAKYIKFGAKVVYGFDAQYGPVRVVFMTAFAFDASLIFRPFQAEARLWFLAELGLYVFCFKLGLALEAELKVTAPKPFSVYGRLNVRIGLPWPLPSPEFTIELKWEETPKPEPETPFLKTVEFIHHKGKNYTIELPSEANEADVKWEEIPFVPVDGRPVLQFNKPIDNDYDLGSLIRRSKLETEPQRAITFKYLIADSEEYKVKLEKYDEEIGNWVTLTSGFKNEDEDGDAFILDENSYLNGIDAKEPKVQLWQYSPFDMARKPDLQVGISSKKNCEPVLSYLIKEVEFGNRRQGELLSTTFIEDSVRFYGSDTFSIWGSDTRYLSMKMEKHRLPLLENNIDTKKQDFYSASITLKFKKPITYLVIEFVSWSHFPIKGQNSDMKMYELECSLNSVKVKDESIESTVVKSQFVCSGIKAKKAFDTISIHFMSIGRREVNMMLMERVLYLEQYFTKGTTEPLNLISPNSKEQNQLYLEPNSKYRLSIPTQTLSSFKDTSEIKQNNFYFKTDLGPGISKLHSNELIPYHKEPFHQFERYIASTTPFNGAKNFYYSYSLLILYNEGYLKALYDNNIKLVIKDQNYKTIYNNSKGTWLDISKHKIIHTHKETLTQLAAINATRTCKTEHTLSVKVKAYPLQGLKPNRRYFCSQQVLNSISKVWETVYEFEFVTSQYSSLREHLTGSDTLEDKTELKTVYLSTERKPETLDFSPLLKLRENYLNSIQQFYSLNNSAELLAPALDTIKKRALAQHTKSSEFFDKLYALVIDKFNTMGLEKEPTKLFELVCLEMPFKNLMAVASKRELTHYILLFESPEPLEWERFNAKLVGKSLGLNDLNAPRRRPRRVSNPVERNIPISLEAFSRDHILRPIPNFRDTIIKPKTETEKALLASEISVLKELDRKDKIKTLVDFNNIVETEKIDLFKAALQKPTKLKDVSTELTFIWNKDKTSAFAIFDAGTFNKQDQGLFATRGNYQLEISYKGDKNPELNLLLNEEGEAISDKISFNFDI